MNIDRRRILQQWSNAKRAAANPDLPLHIRVLAAKARSHAEIVLGMQDAAKRKAEREKNPS